MKQSKLIKLQKFVDSMYADIAEGKPIQDCITTNQCKELAIVIGNLNIILCDVIVLLKSAVESHK